eukprot:c51227_g1_i1 orf=61-216(+)
MTGQDFDIQMGTRLKEMVQEMGSGRSPKPASREIDEGAFHQDLLNALHRKW